MMEGNFKSTAHLTGGIYYLILSLSGYIFILGMFLSALFFPLNNIEFIFRTGFFLFLSEFLILGLSVMLVEREKMLVVLFSGAPFLIAVLWYGLRDNDIFMPIIFFINLILNVIRYKKDQNKSVLIYSVAAFCVILALIGFISPVLGKISVAPEELFSKEIMGARITVNYYYSLLAWGLLYYSFLCLFEIRRYMAVANKRKEVGIN